MAREGTVSLGISVPDFVSNKDVYAAIDEACKYLEEKHIDVNDSAVDGLPPQPDFPKEDV